MKKRVSYLLLFIFLSSFVSSATYYVCDNGADCNAGAGSGWSTGSDSNNGLSKSAPLKTIQKGADIVNPGDTVIVGDGIYTNSDPSIPVILSARSGSAGNYITYKSENKWGAVLDGENAGYSTVRFNKNSYIIFDGFEVKNAYSYNIEFKDGHLPPPGDDTVHHNILRNVYSHGSRMSSVVFGYGAYDILIENNYIYNWASYGEPGHGLYLNGFNFNVRNNIIVKGSASTGNYGVKLGWHDAGSADSDWGYFVNNLIDMESTNSYSCIVISNNHGAFPSNDAVIRNNVFLGCGNPYGSEPDCAIRDSTTDVDSGWIITNNVADAPVLFYNKQSGTPSESNNKIISNGVTSANLKAQFNNPDNNDYSLATPRPGTEWLVDKGTSSNAPEVDFLGVSRPQGSAIDIGAYEYFGTSPGGQGIAAGYPYDIGIKNHPNVIFATGFETPNWPLDDFAYTGSLKDGYEHTTDPSLVLSGGGSLQIQQQAGTHNPSEFHTWMPDDYDTVYVRWYRKYENGYDWTQHKMPGVYARYNREVSGGSAGVRPDGTDKFSCKLFVNPSAQPKFYSYHPEQPGIYGNEISQNIGNVVSLETGRWYSIEMMLKSNTVGQHDGELKMWIDGELKGHITGMRFRDIDELKINQFIHSAYVGGSWVSEQDQKLWDDNLVVASEYIGPMLEGTVTTCSSLGGVDCCSAGEICDGNTISGASDCSLCCMQQCKNKPQTGNCDSLIALYHFNGDVDDSSGNGNHGTVYGAESVSSGRFGGAFNFDGVDDFVDVGPDSSLVGMPELTLSAWVYPQEEDLCAIANSKVDAYILRTAPTAGFYLRNDISSSGYLTWDTAPPTNQWSHIAATYDGSIMKLFLNGIEQTTTKSFTGSIRSSSNGVEIGGDKGSADRFNGKIDEVAIWSRALSASEISDLYNSGAPVYCGTVSSCGNSDTDSNGMVDIDELIVYINDWKTGSVSISEIMDAVGKWKSGC